MAERYTNDDEADAIDRAVRFARPTSPYRLPDGRVVLIADDTTRGDAVISYELARTADGERRIVDAVRVQAQTVAPAPRWCQDVARSIVTTVNEWAADGATEAHLVQCVADLLEQELLDQRLIERLAQVYTVSSDQVALIALVREAQAEVARVR